MEQNDARLQVKSFRDQVSQLKSEQNIRARGRDFIDGFSALMDEFPGVVTSVTGTGLLFAAEIDPDRFPVVGPDGIEVRCRRAGIGVIHGGQNALRVTPHFRVTKAEVDLIVDGVRQVLRGLIG